MSEPIPAGIYFDIGSDNFYSVERGCGCGTTFFLEWKPHWQEFPICKDGAIALMPKWRSMKDAPRNATEIILKIPCKGWPGYYAQIGHWAEIDGSEQPPGKGWFRATGYGYTQLEEPTGWLWLSLPHHAVGEGKEPS